MTLAYTQKTGNTDLITKYVRGLVSLEHGTPLLKPCSRHYWTSGLSSSSQRHSSRPTRYRQMILLAAWRTRRTSRLRVLLASERRPRSRVCWATRPQARTTASVDWMSARRLRSDASSPVHCEQLREPVAEPCAVQRQDTFDPLVRRQQFLGSCVQPLRGQIAWFLSLPAEHLQLAYISS